MKIPLPALAALLCVCLAGCVGDAPETMKETPVESLLALGEAQYNRDVEALLDYTEPNLQKLMLYRMHEMRRKGREKIHVRADKDLFGEPVFFEDLAFIPATTLGFTRYVLMKKGKTHWVRAGNDPCDILRTISYAIDTGTPALVSDNWRKAKLPADVFENPDYEGFPKAPFATVTRLEKGLYYEWLEVCDAKGKVWDIVMSPSEQTMWGLYHVTERKGPGLAIDLRRIR